jgi:multicomponent Na+:H+ antiporter subunit C
VTGNVTIALLIGVLYTVGTYLLLQRTLTRVVIGLGLLGHGANLLLLQAGGAAGGVPFVGKGGREGQGLAGLEGGTADPLPQAMVLTAIVITFGVSAFLLALAYRSWLLTDEDEVRDDLEDARVMRLGREEEARRAAEAAAREPVEDDA